MIKVDRSGTLEPAEYPLLRSSIRNSVKIAIVISSFQGSSSGQGGHFYSARSLATALRQNCEVYIFNVGNMEAKALDDYDGPMERVAFSSPYDLGSMRHLERRFIDFGIDLAHGFDRNTVTMLRIISGRCRLPVVFTSPGGLKAGGHPAVKNLIVFNRSALNSFRALTRFKRSQMHLIPNRALPLTVNRARLETTKLPIDSRKFTFITINRLTSRKEHQIVQSLNLVEELHHQNLPVELIVIGIDEGSLNQKTYSRLRSLRFCHLLTDSKYTKRASDFLSLADAVIAMGRGVMEACANDKVVLVSPSEGEFPVLLDEHNFEPFFEENFTNRCRIEVSAKASLMDITDLITDQSKKRHAEQLSSDLFNKFFDIRASVPQYLEIYRESEVNGTKISAVLLSYILSKLPAKFADRVGRRIFKFFLPA